MEEEIVTLIDQNKEEPWCSQCLNFTDYKRKWTTYPRADLDGGTYPENIEVPHCIKCGLAMYYLKSCKNLVWGVRFLGLFFVLVSTLLCFFLFELSVLSLCTWTVSIFLIWLFCKIPVQSRKALRTYSQYITEKPSIIRQT